MTSLTMEAVEPLGVKPRDAERSKNFFALGLVIAGCTPGRSSRHDRLDRAALQRQAAWSPRPTSPAFKAGYNFGETAELFDHPYEVKPAALDPGHLHQHHRQHRAGLGPDRGRPAVASCRSSSAATRSRRRRTSSTSCRKHKNFGVRTLQAEDEIAGIGAALGAAYGGHLGVTTTSGPGHRPQVRDHRPGRQPRAAAADHRHPARRPVHRPAHQDRAGRPAAWPCTAATASRRCRSSPPRTPADCFFAAIEAARIALKYRTPVILLSDGYLANGAEPWRLPDVADLPDISVPFATDVNHTDADGTEVFWPYLRDPETLARPWAIPGTPGLMHRIGGLEKEDGHRQRQLRPGQPRADGAPAGRQGRRHRRRHPAARGRGDVDDAELLVLGWGSTWGAIDGGVEPGAGAGPQGRPRPPAPPQPVPAATSARCSAATPRSSSRR